MAAASRMSLALFIALPAAYFTGVISGFPFLGALVFVVTALSWLWPETTLLLLLAAVPICRSPQSRLFPPELIAPTKAILVSMCGLIYWMKQKTRWAFEDVPVWLKAYLLGWVFLTTLSWLNAQDPWESISDLSVAVSAVFIFFVVGRGDAALHKKIILSTAAMGILIALYSLLQYAILRYRIAPALWDIALGHFEKAALEVSWSTMLSPISRVSGTFHHPNSLGTYFYLLIPFVCASLSVSEFTKYQRFFLASALVLLLAGLYATNSRAGLLAALLTFAYLGAHRGNRWLLAVGLSCLLGVGFLYARDPAAVTDYFRTISRVESGLSSRAQVWKNALELIERYPWLGVGPSNFPSQYYAHFGFFVYDYPEEIFLQVSIVQTEWDRFISGFHAHNAYLQVVGEYGIFALPLFLFGVIALILFTEKRAHDLAEGSFGRSMALATAAFGVSFLAASFFDSYQTFSHMGLIGLAAPLVAIGVRGL